MVVRGDGRKGVVVGSRKVIHVEVKSGGSPPNRVWFYPFHNTLQHHRQTQLWPQGHDSRTQ